MVMGVDYQVRVWRGSVCGDGCGLSGEGVGRCAGESGWSGT